MPYFTDEEMAVFLGVGSVHDVSGNRSRKKVEKEPIGFKPPQPKKSPAPKEEPKAAPPKKRRKKEE
jgi:hypothetical protein